MIGYDIAKGGHKPPTPGVGKVLKWRLWLCRDLEDTRVVCALPGKRDTQLAILPVITRDVLRRRANAGQVIMATSSRGMHKNDDFLFLTTFINIWTHALKKKKKKPMTIELKDSPCLNAIRGSHRGHPYHQPKRFSFIFCLISQLLKHTKLLMPKSNILFGSCS